MLAGMNLTYACVEDLFKIVIKGVIMLKVSL